MKEGGGGGSGREEEREREKIQMANRQVKRCLFMFIRHQETPNQIHSKIPFPIHQGN